MSLTIRRATVADISAIHELLVECGSEMARAGFHNWNPPATPQRLQHDIAEREVYVALDGEKVVATVTASTEPTVAYDSSAQWHDRHARALYVNRLAVKPALQGNGLGRLLSDLMEQRARESGCAAVRLDALAANKRLLEFYARSDYEMRFEREHSGWQFVCLEKLID